MTTESRILTDAQHTSTCSFWKDLCFDPYFPIHVWVRLACLLISNTPVPCQLSLAQVLSDIRDRALQNHTGNMYIVLIPTNLYYCMIDGWQSPCSLL